MAISRNQKCPCGSGKKYKRCCINKEENDFPSFQDVLDIENRKFKEKMGRDQGPNDFVFTSLVGKSPDDVIDGLAARCLENGWIDEREAYAFKKSKTLVIEGYPGKHNDEQLKAWGEALKEYDDIQSGRKSAESEIDLITAELNSSLDGLHFLYDLILRKYSNNKPEIRLAQTIDINDYIAFCLTKNVKSIKAINILVDNNYGEDALNLTRTNFENYLEIVYAKFEPNHVIEHLYYERGVIDGTHKRQGKYISNIETGERIKTLTNYEKAELNRPYRGEDIEIYKYLYDFLSSYTHLDLRTASNYIHEELGFLAAGRNMRFESLIYLLVINFLILNEIKELDIFESASQKDISGFLCKLGDNLTKLFTLKQEMPECIKVRINKTMQSNNITS